MAVFRSSKEMPATPQAVFAAVQDPARLARWWGPRGFTNTLAPSVSVPCAAFILLYVTCSAAQSTTPQVAPLPKLFIGAGAGPSTNDAASRMRLYEERLAAVWLVEAGAAVTRRIGVGAEYSWPSAATAFTTIGAGRAQIAGRQEERVLLAIVRARTIGVNRWALDLAAGAGVLFQRHASGGCVPAQTRCENTDGPSLERRAPAVAAGLEVPVRVGSHFEIATHARVFALRRGEHTSATDSTLTWQNEWRSSTRTALVVVGRAVW